jgi:signal recognition particle subunit SEC65
VTTPPSKGLVVELYLIYFGLSQSFEDDTSIEWVKKMKDPSMNALKAMNQNPMASMAQDLQEIKLPNKPDTSVSYPWPSHDSKVLQQCDTFYQIYPSYLDSSKTQKLGRRLPLKDCVDTPSVMEISECLQSMRLRHVIEPHKGYSRDVESRWYNAGRVLVDKKQKGIIPLDDRMTFDNKMHIMKEVSRRLPVAPSRVRRLAAEERKQKELEANPPPALVPAIAAGGPAAGGATPIAVGSTKKKKGKKGRK